MVISIEPGIYLDGIGGVRHSDTVLITRDGFRLLTQSATDLGSLVIRRWKPLARCQGWMVRRALGLTEKMRLKPLTNQPLRNQ
jgi:Xaa-Pro dipeptidase